MDNRFEAVKYEAVTFPAPGWTMEVYVLRDKQTGVMYIAERTGNSGGLTPLLDKEGKPMTTFKVNI